MAITKKNNYISDDILMNCVHGDLIVNEDGSISMCVTEGMVMDIKGLEEDTKSDCHGCGARQQRNICKYCGLEVN